MIYRASQKVKQPIICETLGLGIMMTRLRICVALSEHCEEHLGSTSAASHLLPKYPPSGRPTMCLAEKTCTRDERHAKPKADLLEEVQ